MDSIFNVQVKHLPISNIQLEILGLYGSRPIEVIRKCLNFTKGHLMIIRIRLQII